MMNKHQDNREELEFLLSRYLDGDLDDADRQRLERRLAVDAELAGLLDEFRRTDRLVQAWSEPRPKLDWERQAVRINERIEHDRNRGQRHKRILWLSGSLSAAAMIALAVLLSFSVDGLREPAAEPVATVIFQRADAWRVAVKADTVMSEVSFDRSAVQFEALRAGSVSTGSVAVAAVGVGSPSGLISENPNGDDVSAPFF